LRNLARNRRRTALALLVVAAGASALLLTAGYVRDSFHGMREAFVHGGLGHLEVSPANAASEGAGLERPTLPSFAEWRATRATVESQAHVVGASGVIVLHGLVARDDRSLPFVGTGFETDREARMDMRARVKSGGPLPEAPPREGEDGVLLGLGLARQIGAGVGDVVTLTALAENGFLNALDVRVVGLVTTGVRDLDLRFLRVHLVTAQRLLGTDAVSSVIVMLDDTERTEDVRNVLAGQLGHAFAVSDWQERAAFYGQVRTLYRGLFTFLCSVVLVLICLSSSNTLLMAVTERTREFGALLALGTSGGQLVAMIVMESAWLGLIGGALGCVLGFGMAALIHALGVEVPPPPGAVDGFLLRLEIAPYDPLWVIGLMTVILMASAVVPAIRVLRLRIVEALAHV
jgi:putative ABC transport system permease protein